MRLLLALWLVPASASSAAGKGDAPLGVYSQQVASVHELMDQAYAMAKRWNPKPVLYSIHGDAPPIAGDSGHGLLDRSSIWTFVFGDPASKSGVYEIEFAEGQVYRRKVVTGATKREETFMRGEAADDGRPSSANEQEGWNVNKRDYNDCAPIKVMFLDTPSILKLLAKHRFPPDGLLQYHFALVKPMNDFCASLDGPGQGVGAIHGFRPYPRAALGRAVWAVHNCRAGLFLDAETGDLVARESFSGQVRKSGCIRKR